MSNDQPRIIDQTNHAHVDDAVLRESYAKYIGGLAPSSKLRLIESLEQHFSSCERPVVACPACDGWSSTDLPKCAYCGEPRNKAITKSEAKPAGALEAMRRVTRDPDVGISVRPSARSGRLTSDLPEGADGAREFARRFNAALAQVGASFHDLGTALNEAQEGRIHERLGMRWDDYADEYFDVPRTTAHRIQRVARMFDREQVALLGVSKAYELTALPEAERAKLLPQAQNMSVRKLRDAVVQTLDPTATKAIEVAEPSAVTIIRLPAEGTIDMTKIGPSHAIGVILGVNGGGLSLAIAPDKNGQLVMHVTPIGGSR